MKKILFCLLAFYTPVSIVIAQNTTNSPTSMFGLGELSTGEGGQYAGLGGTGIALRGNNFLNNANPASLTELTEQRFQIDAGIMGAYQIYSQRGASNRSVTGNLNNLSIGCTLFSKKWITNITGDRKVTLLQCRIQLGNIYLMDFYQIFADRLQLTVSAI